MVPRHPPPMTLDPEIEYDPAEWPSYAAYCQWVWQSIQVDHINERRVERAHAAGVQLQFSNSRRRRVVAATSSERRELSTYGLTDINSFINSKYRMVCATWKSPLTTIL